MVGTAFAVGGRVGVLGAVSRQEEQAGQDECTADGLSCDERLAEDEDGGQRSGQGLHGEQQARPGGADRVDPDVEREQADESAEQDGHRGDQLVVLRRDDAAPAGPPRSDDEGEYRDGGPEELPGGAADASLGGHP